ncbi:MAG: hypothetical protein M1824_004316 [Vezdaea acicularis]|nr:MAG: hypothetical protein M1824_004316 [Vezdaea acicularis]
MPLSRGHNPEIEKSTPNCCAPSIKQGTASPTTPLTAPPKQIQSLASGAYSSTIRADDQSVSFQLVTSSQPLPPLLSSSISPSQFDNLPLREDIVSTAQYTTNKEDVEWSAAWLENQPDVDPIYIGAKEFESAGGHDIAGGGTCGTKRKRLSMEFPLLSNVIPQTHLSQPSPVGDSEKPMIAPLSVGGQQLASNVFAKPASQLNDIDNIPSRLVTSDSFDIITQYSIPPPLSTHTNPITPQNISYLHHSYPGFVQTTTQPALDGISGYAAPAATAYSPSLAHFCDCGDSCACPFCPVHPYNQTSADQLKEMGLGMDPNCAFKEQDVSPTQTENGSIHSSNGNQGLSSPRRLRPLSGSEAINTDSWVPPSSLPQEITSDGGSSIALGPLTYATSLYDQEVIGSNGIDLSNSPEDSTAHPSDYFFMSYPFDFINGARNSGST